MKIIDASAVIHGSLPDGELAATPAVLQELKGRLEEMKIEARLPSKKSVEKVKKAAEKTGDIHDLSENDIELVALALQEKALLVTDDYSMQNVAEELGIKWEGAAKKGIRSKWKWELICSGCGRQSKEKICQVCGSNTKRKPIDK